MGGSGIPVVLVELRRTEAEGAISRARCLKSERDNEPAIPGITARDDAGERELPGSSLARAEYPRIQYGVRVRESLERELVSREEDIGRERVDALLSLCSQDDLHRKLAPAGNDSRRSFDPELGSGCRQGQQSAKERC
jgi:hypothetical protein